jgi:hypothetical protein
MSTRSDFYTTQAREAYSLARCMTRDAYESASKYQLYPFDTPDDGRSKPYPTYNTLAIVTVPKDCKLEIVNDVEYITHDLRVDEIYKQNSTDKCKLHHSINLQIENGTVTDRSNGDIGAKISFNRSTYI